jgi:[ribosomal protein S5]-alanine N-acetyltransferase
MKLKSKRIDIVPLNFDELKLFVKSREEYEKKHNLVISGVQLNQDYCEELLETTEQNQSVWSNKNDNYLFCTIWVLIERNQKVIVGQFTFNGKPNPLGEVEVFFSIENPYRKNGYATEVMETILAWGGQSELFKIVLIEADFDNRAAMASLKKLGFRRVYSDEEENETPSTKFFKKVSQSKLTENLDFDT